MNLRFALLMAIAVVFACAPAPAATILIEDFEAPFPAWESGWLGANSNLRNYYGIGAGRGNNPDGLWMDDGDGLYGEDTSQIVFSTAFGASLMRFELDIASHIAGTRLEIFDSSGLELLSTAVPLGGFRLISGGSQIEGNTGIDNVMVEQGGGAVPELAVARFWAPAF